MNKNTKDSVDSKEATSEKMQGKSKAETTKKGNSDSEKKPTSTSKSSGGKSK